MASPHYDRISVGWDGGRGGNRWGILSEDCEKRTRHTLFVIHPKRWSLHFLWITNSLLVGAFLTRRKTKMCHQPRLKSISLTAVKITEYQLLLSITLSCEDIAAEYLHLDKSFTLVCRVKILFFLFLLFFKQVKKIWWDELIPLVSVALSLHRIWDWMWD